MSFSTGVRFCLNTCEGNAYQGKNSPMFKNKQIFYENSFYFLLQQSKNFGEHQNFVWICQNCLNLFYGDLFFFVFFPGEVEVDLHSLQRNEVVKINSQLNKSCRRKNLRGEIQLTLTFNPVGQILRVTVNQVSNSTYLSIINQISGSYREERWYNSLLSGYQSKSIIGRSIYYVQNYGGTRRISRFCLELDDYLRQLKKLQVSLCFF